MPRCTIGAQAGQWDRPAEADPASVVVNQIPIIVSSSYATLQQNAPLELATRFRISRNAVRLRSSVIRPSTWPSVLVTRPIGCAVSRAILSRASPRSPSTSNWPGMICGLSLSAGSDGNGVSPRPREATIKYQKTFFITDWELLSEVRSPLLTPTLSEEMSTEPDIFYQCVLPNPALSWYLSLAVTVSCTDSA